MSKESRAEGRESKGSGSGSRPSTLAPRPVIEVSAGLVFRSGKLLITQRHADAHLGGLWEFPGGKREAGESFEQCLVRELNEELGVEVVVGKLFDSVTHAYPERTVLLKFFLCTLPTGDPQAIDCAAVKWVNREELPAHDFPGADAGLLSKLIAERALWS
jgi:8-oxo-dGTP diphosphatase